MYSYNNHNKSKLKAILTRHYFGENNDKICGCIQQKANNIKQGWNDPSQTENARISRILTGTLGGKTTFGNLNRPAPMNYLGSIEGQSGGSFRPLRNKF